MLYIRKVTNTSFASLIFVILSKAGNWAGIFPCHCFVLLLASWHIELSIPAKLENPCTFFSRYKKRKIFFLSIFLLILANVNSTSLNGQHFCLPCVFSAVLEFFVFLPLVLEVSSNVISEILFMFHFSNIKKSLVNLCTLCIRKRDFEMEYSYNTSQHIPSAMISIHQMWRIALST